jgi:PKD repeat protein
MFVNRHFFLLILVFFPVIIIGFSEIVSANNSVGVVINEIAWMGTENSSTDEWIELYNETDSEIILTGWMLKSTTSSFSVNLSGSIPARGYFLLERTDDSSVPGISANQIYSGSLNNNGENIELRNSQNILVDSINCSGGWTAGDNATKQTMEKNNNSWQTSAVPGGTPKAQNSSISAPDNNQPPSNNTTPALKNNNYSAQIPKAEAGNNIVALINQEITFDGSGSSDPQNKPLSFQWNFGDGKTSTGAKATHSYKYPGTYIINLTVNNGQNSASDTLSVNIYSTSILISEFIPSPEGPDKENEWVELYNNSDQITDISSWQIANQNEKAKPFSLPQNTLVAPRQFLVIHAETSRLSLRNAAGSLKLLYPNGQTAQEIKYEKSKTNQSIALAGNNQYFWTNLPTPGAANIIASDNFAAINNSAPNYTAQEPADQQTTNIINNADSNQSVGTWVEAGVAPNSATQTTGATDTNQTSQSASVNKIEIDTNNSAARDNQNGKNQTASLINKISSPFLLLPAIVIFGFLVGLGMVKLKKSLKLRASKTPIDWQD